MFKKLKFILTSTLLIACFALLSSESVMADCNPGHYSTGNQDFGGPNGKWELVCDEAHDAVCCVSHPDEEEEETLN
ncbi:hypothetical protein Belba_0783 [Belliella baltica DSM 15883]|uniref:Secreted protein n=1 Tax=Belliella baltica (strain DSM 15883 / CIP 108006 / LMG 21964 / BA134) TaxID=866536 RepID=I3Z2G5_BELBD|nr:hypothetical protein [Belliella baltica]AFL83433.1 hypothetical protein Belba_0783 [Belliella baltica DSM 15883]